MFTLRMAELGKLLHATGTAGSPFTRTYNQIWPFNTTRKERNATCKCGFLFSNCWRP